MVEHRNALLIELLCGNIDRHSVEVRRSAVVRIIGAAERAYPFNRSGVRMHGAVNDVIRSSIADRCVDRVPSRGTVLLVNSCIEIFDGDSLRRREKEVLLDPLVPFELSERQVAVPETDT